MRTWAAYAAKKHKVNLQAGICTKQTVKHAHRARSSEKGCTGPSCRHGVRDSQSGNRKSRHTCSSV